jgi:hypothetical protein
MGGDVMTATRRQRAIIVVGAMLVSTLLFGCEYAWVADPGLTQEGRERIEQAAKQDAQATPPPQVEPDQVLAEGKVLSVRVDYGNSGATVVEVRIDNDRTGWYDEIEFMCLADDCELGAPPRTYQDYDFGSENFNKQLNHPEWWDPEGVPGDYQVTMEADTGHSRDAVVRWDGERFVPNLLYFSLD